MQKYAFKQMYSLNNSFGILIQVIHKKNMSLLDLDSWY